MQFIVFNDKSLNVYEQYLHILQQGDKTHSLTEKVIFNNKSSLVTQFL